MANTLLQQLETQSLMAFQDVEAAKQTLNENVEDEKKWDTCLIVIHCCADKLGISVDEVTMQQFTDYLKSTTHELYYWWIDLRS